MFEGKRYHASLLVEGEAEILVTNPHIIVFLGNALGGALLLLAAGGLGYLTMRIDSTWPAFLSEFMIWGALAFTIIGVAIVLWQYICWRSVEYIITTQRVINVRGVISKHTFDSRLDSINDLRLSQSILGRLLNYGNLEVMTGNDENGDVYECISRPRSFLRVLEQQREERYKSYRQSQINGVRYGLQRER
jgi:uncharacterized membrane protein YdbT with pleckstrin-like domain